MSDSQWALSPEERKEVAAIHRNLMKLNTMEVKPIPIPRSPEESEPREFTTEELNSMMYELHLGKKRTVEGPAADEHRRKLQIQLDDMKRRGVSSMPLQD